MYDTTDTIAAIATPLGESGIGVIRISGSHAYAVGDAIFRSPSGTPLAQRRDRSIQHGLVVADDGRPVDEVLMLIMKAPIPIRQKTYWKSSATAAAKPWKKSSAWSWPTAPPGQSRRIYAAGFCQRPHRSGPGRSRHGCYPAKSRQGLTSAVNQLEGRLSKVIGAMRHELTDFITRLEVTIDYPEEDLEDITVPDVAGAIRKQLASLDEMLEASHDGRIIRDGVMAAIAGTPNAGKSSLLNRLLQEDRAIVTDVPGTTRDVLEEWISLKGVPVCLVDTAGIRETDDTVEKIGVTKAKAYMDKADIILVVIDSSRPLSEEDRAILEDTKERNVLIVLNKSDLTPVVAEKDLGQYGHPVLSLSAGTGEGLEA